MYRHPREERQTRDQNHLNDLYRDLPQVPQKASLKPEKEVERYYSLLHVKLSPRRLRIISAINVFLVMGIVMLFFAGSFLLEKPTESAIEKRKLAERPAFSVKALFDGTLMRETEAYFSDTFPLRDFFVTLSAVMDEGRGIRIDGVRIVAPINQAEAQPGAENADAIPPTPPASPQPENNGQPPAEAVVADVPEESSSAPTEEEKQKEAEENESVGPISNGTFVYKGMAMSLFGGTRSSADAYANALNNYQKELPGVQIYDMVIPTAIEFYVPEEYRDLTNSQKDATNYIYSKLNPAIKRVNAYDTIAAHTEEYLYFRTDHHWTGLGAYYAYTAFCEQAGLSPLQIKDFETRRLDNFIGTMYAQNPDSTLLKNPDYVDYYIFKQPYTAVRYDRGAPYKAVEHNLWGEYATSPNSYSVFLQGDFPLIVAKTGIHNGRKIMVVKESFGNAFAPFLINHYEEVHIVDQRYFELAAVDYIKKQGINELIFANNIFAALTPYHIKCIDGMRHHTYYSYTPPKKKTEETSSEEKPAEESSSAPPDEEENVLQDRIAEEDQSEEEQEPSRLSDRRTAQNKGTGQSTQSKIPKRMQKEKEDLHLLPPDDEV